MTEMTRKDKCSADLEAIRDYREDIPQIVERLVQSCDGPECFDHVGPEPIPSRDAIIAIVHQLLRILYPGYFISERLDRVNLHYYLGQEATSLFEELSRQISFCIRHDCIRYDQPCTQCQERGRQEAIRFMQELPNIRVLLGKDVRAVLEGDPATDSYDEVIFSYPGLFAISVHRVAHQLLRQGITLMPRIISEYAHGRTGIDIHPGAHLGESFFIDHGVGVVIGETSEIGNRVRIYQGVTLGALSLPKGAGEKLRNKKRHPTIEDDVIIYSGATILGGNTVIGARSVIGGNVWLTESVPPDTRVFLKTPELIKKENRGTQQG